MNKKTLKEICLDHHGKVSDKWTLYIQEYDRLLAHKRSEAVRLLEIGIQNGGSLEIWADYFPLAEKIIGCDINPDCARLSYSDSRVAVVVADANLDGTEQQILALSPQFDVIIDDGSHRSSDIVRSFVRYFPHLADGGMMLVEDLHCSYWAEFEGGLYDPTSSIKFFKSLADVINHEHWGIPRSRAEFLDSFALQYGIRFDEQLLRHVHSIEFVNSLCVVRKAVPALNELGERVIVGETELVASDVKSYNGSHNVPLNQRDNIWSNSVLSDMLAKDSTIAALNDTVRMSAEHAVKLDNIVAERNGQIAGLHNALAERDEKTLGMHGIIAERDGHIAVLYRSVEERDGHIAVLHRSVEERDVQALALQTSLSGHIEQLGRVHQTIEHQSRELAELNSKCTDYAANALINGQRIEQMEVNGVELTSALRENIAKVETLNSLLSERDREIQTLGEHVTRCDLLLTAAQEASSVLKVDCDAAHGSLLHQQEQLEQTRRSLESAVLHMANLEHQRDVLNSELARMTAEAARFGARVGRKIGQVRARLAPIDTRRGAATTLGVRFISKLVTAGPKAATSAAYRYLSVRLRSRPQVQYHERQMTLASPAASVVVGPRTDHPQLTAWMLAHEPKAAQLAEQVTLAEQFAYRPLISVVLPVYKVPRDVLFETLDCLTLQTYAHWEACVVWADSDDLAGWQWLQEKTASDSRFKIRYLAENAGISGNSNAALELVTGEYVALLDHDDTLSSWAFYEVVKVLQARPEVDFLYSDKDSMTADGGIRLNALFKPDWSPEMLHSVNYLTHLNVMRTRIVREIGGWHQETDGAQDWDIFFRVIEQARHVARIPSILYHWRILPTSTATGLAAKPYAALGQLRTQQNYFKRRGLPATVLSTQDGLFHVVWPSSPVSVDVLVYQGGSAVQLINLLQVLQTHSSTAVRTIYVVHHTIDTDLMHAVDTPWSDQFVFIAVARADWRVAVEALPKGSDNTTLVLVDGSASTLSSTLVEELSGWVEQHPDIAWTSAIALSPEQMVYEAGRVVAADYTSAPMFAGSPLYSFGWFGGPLWYRNARAASPYAFAARLGDMRAALAQLDGVAHQQTGFDQFCLALSHGGRRGLINPYARVYFNVAPEVDWFNDGHAYHADPYFNPAFDQVSPFRLCS